LFSNVEWHLMCINVYILDFLHFHFMEFHKRGGLFTSAVLQFLNLTYL
jgi:hypothetical protein